MSEEPFSGPRLKVDRARSFISELDRLFLAYGEGPNCIARIETSEGEPIIHVEYKAIDSLSGVIIGDVAHNLRSALDILANDVAELTSQCARKVYFPFGDDAEKLDENIKRKDFRLCGEDACELLRSMKPYPNGDVRLWALHKLNIQDKHRTIIPYNGNRNIELTGRFSLDGSEPHVIEVDSIRVEAKFPDDTVLGGLDVIETLTDLANLVEQVIGEFEKLVLSRRAPTPSSPG